MPAPTAAIDVSKPQGAGVRRGTFPSSRSVPMVVNQGMPPAKRAEPSPVTLCGESINDEQIADAVAQWLRSDIDPDLWGPVCTEAQLQVTCFPTREIDLISFGTLIELVSKTRAPNSPVDVFEMVNFSVDWLLNWLLVLRRDPCRIHRIVGVGYARAMKGRGRPAA
jgi:hypothetical protein